MTPTGVEVGERRGMQATWQHPSAEGFERQLASSRLRCLASVELNERLEEEIARCLRHGTALCCLMVRLDDFAAIARAHGEDLADRALLHACEALLGQTRRFDRIGRPLQNELIVLLPGADAAAGEAVARRGLARLAAIKIEVGRRRQPLSVAVSIAAWQAPWSAQRLIEELRAAARTLPASADGRGAD